MSNSSLFQLFGKLTSSQADECLSEIAARLRAGDVDPDFLGVLAQMIDPNTKGHLFAVRLVPVRTGGAGRPKGAVNADLGKFIADQIEAGVKVEAAISAAIARFRCSRSSCFQSLERHREREDLAREFHELRTFHSGQSK